MSILRSLIKDLLSRKPRDEQARRVKNFDYTLSELTQLEEGVAHYEQMVAANPDDVDSRYNLALLHEGQSRFDDAIAGFKRVLEQNPGHHGARLRLLNLKQKRCEWDGMDTAIEVLRQVVQQPFQPRQEDFLAPYAFLALPGTTPEEQQLCALRYTRLEYKPPNLDEIRNELGFDLDRAPGDKIRIGYLSADFRWHPVAVQAARVFELHDRDRFHITAYSTGRDDASGLRRRLEQSFDDFVDLRDVPLEEAARKIYGDRIDILVDLTAHTRNTKSAVLALRPAPIQVNFLGYPGTMGADFVDYIIADRFVIPPEAQEYYTEKVMWMGDCYLPSDDTRPRPAPLTRQECGLPEKGFVFCCLHQPFKITPAFFDTWCRLLREVPDSVLWLSGRNPIATANLKREAAARGVDPERLVVAATSWAEERHLARMQCADLFLDTSPYNAHSTCSEALWMGLPVLTCTGETFASRVAGSMLTTIGVPELITYSLDDYFKVALDLATHPEKCEEVRQKIRSNRDASSLFDSAHFTRDLEQCYLQMVEARKAAGSGAHG